MRLNYDARTERRKNYWLGISGTVLLMITLITCFLTIN